MDWLNELLKLLFGQVGVLGTVLIGMVFYIGRLLEAEQKAHTDTRKRSEDTGEKRTVLFETYLKTMSDLKNAIESSNNISRKCLEDLAAEINRKRQ